MRLCACLPAMNVDHTYLGLMIPVTSWTVLQEEVPCTLAGLLYALQL